MRARPLFLVSARGGGLVDGGYAESSGLATLSDLATRLMALVAAHNARVSPQGGDFVVPIVVDFANAFGTDVDPPLPGLAVEPTVPLVGALNGTRQGKDATSWAQRLTAELAEPCVGAAPGCSAAAAAVRGAVGTVVRVAPETEPAVTAPLGWTLSKASRNELRDAVMCPHPSPATETCRRIAVLRTLVDRPGVP